jgi:hypothetical protein
MPDLKEITSLPVESEIHTCPDCGYQLGFHTSFVSASTNRDPVKSTRDVWRVILICPECGARYDVGWRVSFSPVTTLTCIPHGSPSACLPTPFPHDPHLPPE